jgi:hypothetical protein
VTSTHRNVALLAAAWHKMDTKKPPQPYLIVGAYNYYEQDVRGIPTQG